MNGWEDAHGHFVWIFARDALIHLEQVAIPLRDRIAAEPFYRIPEI